MDCLGVGWICRLSTWGRVTVMSCAETRRPSREALTTSQASFSPPFTWVRGCAETRPAELTRAAPASPDEGVLAGGPERPLREPIFGVRGVSGKEWAILIVGWEGEMQADQNVFGASPNFFRVVLPGFLAVAEVKRVHESLPVVQTPVE